MEPAFVLRDAIAADLPAIVAIYNESIVSQMATADISPVTVESRRAWFDAHSPDRYPILVACTKTSEVAGWTSLSPYHVRPGYWPTAEVSTYITTRFHGQGIGSHLRRAILTRCPALGIDTVLSIVFSQNTASIALNHKFGFVRWGHLPGVVDLDGRRLDVEIYGRKVDPDG